MPILLSQIENLSRILESKLGRPVPATPPQEPAPPPKPPDIERFAINKPLIRPPGLLDARALQDTLDRFNNPNYMRQFTQAVGQGSLEVMRGFARIGGDLLISTASLGEAGIVLSTKMRQAARQIQGLPVSTEFPTTPFSAITPTTAQDALTNTAIDVGSLIAGYGLGRLALSPALTSTSRGRLGLFLQARVKDAVKGAGIGLQFAPAITPREGPPSARLEATAEEAVTFAGLQALVFGPLGTQLNKGFLAAAKKWRKPTPALLKEVQEAAEKLNFPQFINNTAPRALGRIRELTDTLADVQKIVLEQAAKGKGLFPAKPSLQFTDAANASIRFTDPEGKRFLKGGVVSVPKQLTTAVSEELELMSLTGRVMLNKLKGLPGMKEESLGTLEVVVSRTEQSIERIVKQRKTLGFNELASLQRNMEELNKQWVLAVNESVGLAPLQHLIQMFKTAGATKFVKGAALGAGVGAVGGIISAAEGERGLGGVGGALAGGVVGGITGAVVGGGTPKQALQPFVASMFGYASFIQDLFGNTMQLAGELGGRGVADTVDFLLHQRTSGGLGAVVNSLKNRRDVGPFVKKLISNRFAAGEYFGVKNPAPESIQMKVADMLLFGGVKGKAGVDTAFRRYFAALKATDIAYSKATQKGLVGLEREMFVQEQFHGGFRGTELAEILEYGNRGAFVIPRGVKATEFFDKNWVRILISPFMRFSLAWADVLARFTPGLGAIPMIGKAIRSGKLAVGDMERLLAQQITGAMALEMADTVIYPDVDWDDPRGLVVRQGDFERVMQSPYTDALMINAAMRGDYNKWKKAAQFSGIVTLGGGLVSPALFDLLNERVTAQSLQRNVNRTLTSLIPGRAFLRTVADYTVPFIMEPFTEKGTFLPFSNILPGGLGLARPQLRPGGGGVESRGQLAIPFTGISEEFGALDLTETYLGKVVPSIPRSLGVSISKTEMNAVQKLGHFLKQRGGKLPNLLQFEKDLPVLNSNEKVDVKVVPDIVKRYFLVKKNEYFAGHIVNLLHDPQWTSLPVRFQQNWVNTLAEAATEHATFLTTHAFPDLMVTGQLARFLSISDRPQRLKETPPTPLPKLFQEPTP